MLALHARPLDVALLQSRGNLLLLLLLHRVSEHKLHHLSHRAISFSAFVDIFWNCLELPESVSHRVQACLRGHSRHLQLEHGLWQI